jgi:hypothetical protein
MTEEQTQSPTPKGAFDDQNNPASARAVSPRRWWSFVAAAFTLLAMLFARKITQLALPGLNVQRSGANASAAAKQANGQPVKTGVPT